MFDQLESINQRPRPFEHYTVEELWNDEHTSEQMLKYHLNPDVDLSSRNHAFIDRSVNWIADRFGVGPGTKVVDFGCGPGLYAFRLALLGATITGVDISKRSIEYARSEAEKPGLEINYINQNYLEFEPDDRFDLAVMIFCDFCVLSPERRARLLSKFQTALKPGGAVLLDVSSLRAFDKRTEQAVYDINILDGFWAPGRYYGFLNTFKYADEKVTLDKWTIVEPGRIRTVYNWLQHYSRESLERVFTEAGFEVEDLYSDVAGTRFDPQSGEYAIVARRP